MLTLFHRSIVVWSSLAIISHESQAQPARREAFATDSTARMYKLAEGVYAITHAAATQDWPHGNTGVVIGNDGVLVIDATYLPDRAARDIALIRRVTNLPVRYLVNTHWHGDHTHGNGVYRDSFPGIAIIGPRASAKFFELNLVKLPLQTVNLEGQRTKFINREGVPISAVVWESFTRAVAQHLAECYHGYRC
jgi:glyoxylase-like metal-dependent hydrolase (beta-lactamase superfamily II)